MQEYRVNTDSDSEGLPGSADISQAPQVGLISLAVHTKQNCLKMNKSKKRSLDKMNKYQQKNAEVKK